MQLLNRCSDIVSGLLNSVVSPQSRKHFDFGARHEIQCEDAQLQLKFLLQVSHLKSISLKSSLAIRGILPGVNTAEHMGQFFFVLSQASIHFEQKKFSQSWHICGFQTTLVTQIEQMKWSLAVWPTLLSYGNSISTAQLQFKWNLDTQMCAMSLSGSSSGNYN